MLLLKTIRTLGDTKFCTQIQHLISHNVVPTAFNKNVLIACTRNNECSKHYTANNHKLIYPL